MNLSPEHLLTWYLDAGVDEAIGEVAADRFAPPPPMSVVEPPPATLAPRPQPPPSAPAIRAQSATAAHVASECHDLEQLRLAMEAFDGLALKRTALSTVFADGNPEAGIMCVGEAPGQEEDRKGLPFVGRSGKLLDRMLGSIGLDRTSVYITNVVPWRPVDNRKPTADEIAACLPFVTRHIELVDPKMLILFGGAAASAILARHDGINRLRGHWFDFSSPGLPRPVPTLATFHPAFLLRTPAAKRESWRDLLSIRKRLSEM